MKAANGHLMPLQQHLYKRFSCPADFPFLHDHHHFFNNTVDKMQL